VTDFQRDRTRDRGSNQNSLMNKKQVASIIEALQAVGKNLATAAAADDMAGVRQNMGAVGQQCGACHKQFRANQP